MDEESLENCFGPFKPLKAAKGLKILHMNSRGLSDAKLDQLQLITDRVPIDFICLSETHHRDDEGLLASSLPNYNTFSQKRNLTTGWGGVVIFAHERHKSSLHVTGSTAGIDFTAVRVEIHNALPLFITCVYRNPKTTPQDSNTILSQLIQNLSGEVILLGDFNFEPSSSLCHLFTSECYHQLIESPTRVDERSSTTIDLVFTNYKQNIVSSGVLGHSLADHLTTFVVRKVNPKRPPRSKHIVTEYRDWRNFTEQAFQELLSAASIDLLANFSNVDIAADSWSQHVINCLDAIAPIKSKRVRSVRKIPWLDSEIFELMHIRDHWHRRFLISRLFSIHGQSAIFWKLYKKVRNMVLSLSRKKKRDCYENMFQESGMSGRNFWRNVKPFLPNANRNEKFIEDLDAVNDSFVDEPSSIRNENTTDDYFEKNSAVLWDSFTAPTLCYSFPEPTFDMIADIIRNLNPSKATGLDGIGPRVLKRGGGYITSMLCELARLSFTFAHFPTKWKTCRVTALPKSDGSMRPLTVIPTPSKIIEEIVATSFRQHLEKVGFWKDNQFGFRKSHSTTCALLCLQRLIVHSLEEGLLCVVVAIDFRKAFDLVDHQLLLDLLLRLNCDDQVISWFRSYLSERRQCVKQGKRASGFRQNNHGVPQGSRLGPLLFVIYIMSLLGLRLNGKLIGYADDASLFYSGSSLEDIQRQINEDFRRIDIWALMYRVVLNISKTHYIIIRGRKKVRDLLIRYRDSLVKRKTEIQLLGVTFTEDFQFSRHCELVKEKVTKRVNVLFRLRHFLPTRVLSTLYTCSINPLLIYCCAVWQFGSKSSIDVLIKLQKKAARAILFKKNSHHSAPLFKVLNWTPIQKQWKVIAVKQIHKCLSGTCAEMLKNVFKEKLITSYSLRDGDQHLLELPRPKKETFLKHSLFYSGAQLYNSLDLQLRQLAYSEFGTLVKRVF